MIMGQAFYESNKFDDLRGGYMSLPFFYVKSQGPCKTLHESYQVGFWGK